MSDLVREVLEIRRHWAMGLYEVRRIQYMIEDASTESEHDLQVRSLCRTVLDSKSNTDAIIALAELSDFLERWYKPRPDASNRDPELNP